MSGGDLDEDLAHAAVGQHLDAQTRRALEAGSPGTGRISRVHLVASARAGPLGESVGGGPSGSGGIGPRTRGGGASACDSRGAPARGADGGRRRRRAGRLGHAIPRALGGYLAGNDRSRRSGRRVDRWGGNRRRARCWWGRCRNLAHRSLDWRFALARARRSRWRRGIELPGRPGYPSLGRLGNRLGWRWSLLELQWQECQIMSDRESTGQCADEADMGQNRQPHGDNPRTERPVG